MISDCGAFRLWEADGLSIYQGNFFDLGCTQLDECNAIYDRAALVALPTETRQEYTQHLNNILPKLTNILLVSLNMHSMKCPAHPSLSMKMRGVAIFAKACFGHPSPSKRQKLNATTYASGGPDSSSSPRPDPTRGRNIGSK
ncbi:hypothetical protein BJAS_P1082 [Bathymodiolus japonicus methanotrophic gill symbiont]|nr:hypothetical protein BJAS_P1082 [Bathymodiolus japonicus methanotrophic gill symbiont]